MLMIKKIGSSFQVKIPLSKSTRIRLTEKLLNWAESLPKKEKDGLLPYLQINRQSQRTLAETTYIRTRPSEGTEIKLIGFEMFEIFRYEEFDRLLQGLHSMFPGIDANRFDESFTSYFKRFSETITGGFWTPVGEIVRENPYYYFGEDVSRYVSNLDPHINAVRVSIQKHLSSLIIVRFDVYLAESATKELIEIQSRKYLSEASLDSIYLRPLFLGISRTFAGSEPSDYVLQFLAGIRNNVEKIIKPFLCGHFMSQLSETCRLPAIEIYSIAGTCKEHDFISWAKNCRGWWSSLGFNFYRGSIFGNDKIIFNWRKYDSPKPFFSANRLIIIPEKFFDETKDKAEKTDPIITIWLRLVDMSWGFIDQIAYIEFLYSSLQNIEKIRRKVFDAIKVRPKNYRNISKYINLYQQFQQLARILRRFFMEYKQQEEIINHFLQQGNDWIEIDIDHINENDKPRNNLHKGILANIKFWEKLLLGQIGFIERNFATQIEFFNIDAIYRLQNTTTFLAIVATILAIVTAIVTIIGLLINPQQGIVVQKSLNGWLEPFIRLLLIRK